MADSSADEGQPDLLVSLRRRSTDGVWDAVCYRPTLASQGLTVAQAMANFGEVADRLMNGDLTYDTRVSNTAVREQSPAITGTA